MFINYPHLFKPIKVGRLTLKNRITNAPICNFLASYDNHIIREGTEFSKPFGKGGAATENRCRFSVEVLEAIRVEVGERNDKQGTLWNTTTSAFDVAMAI